MNDEEQSDEALFRLFRKGDDRAFETLYQRYRQTLYLFLLRSTQATGDADELYQDVWSRIISAAKPFDGGSFKAYVFRIARNLIIDRHRRANLTLVTDQGDLHEPVQPGKSVEEQMQDEECSERLKRHIGQLPFEQREVFLLKEEAGLTLVQIAAMIDAGRETVKSRMRYALKQLRQLLEDCL
ncbi:MAG: sigma-70 family RNA polymerase sigma factor [Candidatus Thiodiazotropha taylori]|nr:sigma-70 family RNA polymerase sigma factor [Candidatus Thiodiazotropha taylori]